MTITRFGTLAVGLGLAAALAACSNDITDLNQNYNSPTSAPPGALFTRASEQLAGRWLGSGYDLRGTEFVTQHLAEVQYPDEDRYSRLQGPQTTGNFNGAYSSELEDFKKVIDAGVAAQDGNIYGPAMVMEALGFQYLTDTWGDVPYSTALQGDTSSGTLTPSYDKQQNIYAGLFAKLDSADAALGNGTDLGSADIIYGGDAAKWKLFENSLRARLAMRIVNVDPTTANAELTTAFDNGVIDDNSLNAQVNWPGDGVYDNPWADNFLTRDDHRMSRTLINILQSDNDPRLAIYAQPTQADPSAYAGMPNGLLNDSAGTYLRTASRPGTIVYDPTRPSVLMSAAEMLFTKAEAAERGLGGLSSGQAAQFYQDAITASMQQWGVPAAQITAYLGQAGVAYQGGAAGLKQIAVQKWIALYGDGGNAWAEWRRTCQPSTIVAGPAAIINFVPRRFEYSQTEYSVNGDNVQAAITQMGGPDNFGTRMWWDTNPTAAPTYVDATTCAGTP